MRHALLGLTLLSMTACLDPDAPLDASDTDPIVFEVAPGSTANGLTDPLLDQGLLPSTWQWKLYLRQADAGCLKAGKFTLRRSMSMSQVLSTLCGPPMVEDEPFTVVEGWRIRDIDEALARKGWIQPGAYRALAESKDLGLPFPVEGPTLEGYLFPETYRVVPDRFTAKDFLERQLTTFQERFLAQHPDGFGDRSLHEVVIMASMLEREEPKPTQRPIVAGILWKRLDHGWKLGVDATSRYTLDEWNDRRAFLTQLRDPNDPFNTRLHTGLPPTAIGNPGLESLEAALQPEGSGFWYYLHDKDGNFHGAQDGAGHEANRRRHNVY